MRKGSSFAAGGALLLLGGCIVSYPYGEYDDELAEIEASAKCSVICGREDHCNPNTCPSYEWAERLGADGGTLVRGVAALADPDGSTIAITGSFYGDFQFDKTLLDNTTGQDEWFVATMNGTLGARWASKVGNGFPLAHVGRGITMTSTSTYTAGSVQGKLPATSVGAFFKRLDRATGNPGEEVFYDGNGTDTGVAIAADGNDVYMLSTMTATADPSNTPKCPMVQEPYADGMFVVKSTAMGECEWFARILGSNLEPIAMSAVNVATGGNGIWIAGTFTGDMTIPEFFDPENPEPSLSTGGETKNGFLIEIEPEGSALRHKDLGPGVVPTAVTMAATGQLYIAGYATGESMFTPGLTENQSAAFVAEFNPKDLEQLKWTIAFPGSTKSQGGVHATSLVVDDNNDFLYVAGVFAESIEIPSSSTRETLTAPGANPFIAKIRINNRQTEAFYHLRGGNEKFVDQAVYLAKANNALILAGSWSQTLELKEPQQSKTLDGGGRMDAFVVLFDPN